MKSDSKECFNSNIFDFNQHKLLIITAIISTKAFCNLRIILIVRGRLGRLWQCGTTLIFIKNQFVCAPLPPPDIQTEREPSAAHTRCGPGALAQLSVRTTEKTSPLLTSWTDWALH